MPALTSNTFLSENLCHARVPMKAFRNLEAERYRKALIRAKTNLALENPSEQAWLSDSNVYQWSRQVNNRAPFESDHQSGLRFTGLEMGKIPKCSVFDSQSMAVWKGLGVMPKCDTKRWKKLEGKKKALDWKHFVYNSGAECYTGD